jgi:hypothetical protein
VPSLLGDRTDIAPSEHISDIARTDNPVNSTPIYDQPRTQNTDDAAHPGTNRPPRSIEYCGTVAATPCGWQPGWDWARQICAEDQSNLAAADDGAGDVVSEDHGHLQIRGLRDIDGGIRWRAARWRHTFACRLINRDVPQEVVRFLLDHDSHRMTSHYAKITDQTVRRYWEKAAKVNITGERVVIDPDGSGPSPVGQDPLRHRHPDPAQRLLRPAGAEELPACQCLLDMPRFPDRTGVPARAARTAPPHAHRRVDRQRA